MHPRIVTHIHTGPQLSSGLTWRFVAPFNGMYLVMAYCQAVASAATGQGYAALTLYQNGGALQTIALQFLPSGVDQVSPSGSVLAYFSAGMVVEVVMFPFTGQNLQSLTGHQFVVQIQQTV